MFLVFAFHEVPHPPRDTLAAWAGSVLEIVGKSAHAEIQTGDISGLVWRIGLFDEALEIRRRLAAGGVCATFREQ